MVLLLSKRVRPVVFRLPSNCDLPNRLLCSKAGSQPRSRMQATPHGALLLLVTSKRPTGWKQRKPVRFSAVVWTLLSRCLALLRQARAQRVLCRLLGNSLRLSRTL